VDRLACVDAAALPLQILLQDHPEWVQLPVAVVEDDRPQAAVLFLNERARKSGVRPGHKYAAALALAPDLQAAVVSQRLESVNDEHIAKWLSDYTVLPA